MKPSRVPLLIRGVVWLASAWLVAGVMLVGVTVADDHWSSDHSWSVANVARACAGSVALFALLLVGATGFCLLGEWFERPSRKEVADCDEEAA